MHIPMSDSRVVIQIVSWNSLTHLPACLEAATAQIGTQSQVLLIDNASVDRTVSWLEERYPQLHLLRNTRNTGFCHAHNQGFRITRSDYVLVLNPDVVLTPDWLARGVDWLDRHSEYATFGGKLLRFAYSGEELKSVVPSDILDSAGLRVFRNRHAIDRGSGEVDRGQYDRPEDVFGHSGACVLYRRTALESIRFKDEYFDEDFFAYKDDLDAAWRLQRMGWRSWYDPFTVAYHFRSAQGSERSTNAAIAKNHRRRWRQISELSYRNHWWLLAKNETWSTVWRDLPWLGWYELKKIIFLAATQPRSLRTIGAIVRKWGTMRSKGRQLGRQARRSALEVRRNFL